MTVDKPWPNALQYAAAVQQPETAFSDPQLRQARFRTDRSGRPHVVDGQTAVVFVADTERGATAIRCLKQPIPQGVERYQYLGGFLRQYPIPVLTSASWESDGITVEGDTWPVIKMDYVEGIRLDRFVELNIANADLLRTVAENWRSTAADLSVGMIAHGDVQPGNILVTPDGRLRLIDLDSIWTPALSDLAPDKPGNRNFQHPEAVGRKFWGRYVDAFPALVVYVSLRALAVDPSLMAYHTSENLIFTAADFQRPGDTALWTSLRLSHDQELSRLTELLAGFCRISVNVRTDLDTILRTYSIPGVPKAPASTSTSPWQTRAVADRSLEITRRRTAPPPGLPVEEDDRPAAVPAARVPDPPVSAPPLPAPPVSAPPVSVPPASTAPVSPAGGLFDQVAPPSAPEIFATAPSTSAWAAPAWTAPPSVAGSVAPTLPAAPTSPAPAPVAPTSARPAPVAPEFARPAPVAPESAPAASVLPITVRRSAIDAPPAWDAPPLPPIERVGPGLSGPSDDAPQPRRIDRRVVLGAAFAAVVAGGAGLGWAELRGHGGGSKKSTGSPAATTPGTALWKVAVPQNVKFTPTDAGAGLLIVEGDDMVGIRVADGSTAWRIAGVSHHVAVANGLMYMQQGVDGKQTLATLKPSDGKVISSVPLSHSVLSLTVAGNTAYYLGAASSTATSATVLEAVDVRDGRVLWTVTKPFSLVNLPIVGDGAVYVGGAGVIWAIKLAGGAPIWSAKLPNTPKPSVRAVAGGMIIARGIDGTYALDPTGGTVMWKVVATDAPFLRSAAGVAAGVIYTSAYGTPAKPGYVRSVRISDGAPLWRSDPTTTTTFAMAHQSAVYVSENRTIASIDEQTGHTHWQYRLDGDCVVEPVGVGNVIIVPTENGALHAIRTGTA